MYRHAMALAEIRSSSSACKYRCMRHAAVVALVAACGSAPVRSEPPPPPPPAPSPAVDPYEPDSTELAVRKVPASAHDPSSFAAALQRSRAVLHERSLRPYHAEPAYAAYHVVPGPIRWQIVWCVDTPSGVTPFSVSIRRDGTIDPDHAGYSTCDTPPARSPGYEPTRSALSLALDRVRAFVKEHDGSFEHPRLNGATFVVAPGPPRWRLSWCVPTEMMGLMTRPFTARVDGDVEDEISYGGDCTLPSRSELDESPR